MKAETVSYTCTICDQSFGDMASYDQHIEAHMEVTTAGNEQPTAEPPQKSETKTKSYGCELCRKKLGTPKGLRSHMIQKHGKAMPGELDTPKDQAKSFPCDYCDESFNDRSSQRKHLLKNHQDLITNQAQGTDSEPREILGY